MGNDISNLLSKFGATVDGYLEIEAAIDYKEPARKVKAPLVVAKAEPATAPVQNEGAAADPAPVVAASAVVPMLAGGPVFPSQRIEPVIEPVVEPAVAAANVSVPAPAAVAPVPPAVKLMPSPSSRVAVAPAQASPAIPVIPPMLPMLPMLPIRPFLRCCARCSVKPRVRARRSKGPAMTARVISRTHSRPLHRRRSSPWSRPRAGSARPPSVQRWPAAWRAMAAYSPSTSIRRTPCNTISAWMPKPLPR